MNRRRGCFSGQTTYDWLARQVRLNKERLIDRLNRNLVDDGDCKVWVPTGSGTKKGYGRISASPTLKLYIHHVFWTLMNCRPIPAGMEIDHTCENRRCVKHLQLIDPDTNLAIRNGKATRT